MEKRKRIIFWLSIAALIIITVLVIIKIVTSPIDRLLAQNISKNDWMQGNPAAKIVLIEYSDFQCPACVNYYYAAKQITAEFGNHMVFAYRHFPLTSLHENAQLAAQASEAAGKQGKFWEMHDLLFEKQKEWENLPGSNTGNNTENNAEEKFIEYAQSLGLNVKQFVEALSSDEIIDAVDEDAESAEHAKLLGTPSFFLNGVKISNPRSLEDFRSLIRNEIEKTVS